LLSQRKVSKLENIAFFSIPLDIFLELYIVLHPYIPNPFNMHLQIASANASQIIQSLHTGFVPVLHGDAVLDELLDCTILSGDVIIRHLAQLLSPKYVVFLMSMEYMIALQLTQMQYF